MTIFERMVLGLEAMLERAEDLWNSSPEDYPSRGERRGMAVISVCEDLENHPDRWITLSDSFGGLCHREPKQLNGRDIDNGGSNDGIVMGKVAYSRRTHHDSGCDARKIKEGESYWMGSMFDEDSARSMYVINAFSGFTEMDDMEVAEAGRATFFAYEE